MNYILKHLEYSTTQFNTNLIIKTLILHSHLSIYLPTYLSIYLSIHLSIYLSIYLSTLYVYLCPLCLILSIYSPQFFMISIEFGSLNSPRKTLGLPTSPRWSPTWQQQISLVPTAAYIYIYICIYVYMYICIHILTINSPYIVNMCLYVYIIYIYICIYLVMLSNIQIWIDHI